MIKVGIAGVGFMGWIHYLAYQRVSGCELRAIATRDPKKLAGDWRDIEGNFGPKGEQVDLTDVNGYKTVEEMIADPEIDLVDICLPPHLHVDVGVAALRAGKHVFCEKPLALTVEGCEKLVAAAKENDRQLLVGHVLPFFPEYAHARKLVEQGEYGKLLGGNFKRIISDPTWLPDFYDLQKVGGPLIDLHVHDAHLIRMLFGMPANVACQGRMKGNVVQYCNSMFYFDDAELVVGATCGTINQQGRPFTHGFEIMLERATMQFEFAAFSDHAESMPLKILTADGGVLRPDLGGGDDIAGFVAEIEEVASTIESGEPSQVLSGDLARDAIILCQRQAQSAEQGGDPVAI